jgi:hypothetical protein
VNVKKKPVGDKARLKRRITRLKAQIVDLESLVRHAQAVVSNPTPATIAMLKAAIRVIVPDTAAPLVPLAAMTAEQKSECAAIREALGDSKYDCQQCREEGWT